MIKITILFFLNCSSEVARHLEEESFGLVFGLNTLLAVILQSVLTLIVVSNSGFALNVIQQFGVYSFYFIVIGIIYFINVIIEYFTNKSENNRNNYLSR